MYQWGWADWPLRAGRRDEQRSLNIFGNLQESCFRVALLFSATAIVPVPCAALTGHRAVDKMWDTKAPSCAPSPADKHAMKPCQPRRTLAFPPSYVTTIVRRPLSRTFSRVPNTPNPYTNFPSTYPTATISTNASNNFSHHVTNQTHKDKPN
jgi:hypothetical protein